MTLNRPDKVMWAVNLLYASLGIGILRGIFTCLNVSKSRSAFVAAVLVTFGSYFLWLIIYKINKGKNWARLTYLAISLVQLAFIRPTFLNSFATQPVLTAIALTQVAIQIIALVLLFQTRSSEWYKQMKVYAQPGRQT